VTYPLPEMTKETIMSFIYRVMEIHSRNVQHLFMVVLVIILFSGGCGAINVGKWRGIERAAPDEAFYLVNDVFLTASSSFSRREIFDHNLNEAVHLYFTPKDEKPTYTVESVWEDPNGQEFRTIRTTYDKAREQKQGIEREKKSTPRIHTVPTKELYAHKPGMWKVSLYLDKQLVRRLTFLVK
jgi:hypothetical protein